MLTCKKPGVSALDLDTEATRRLQQYSKSYFLSLRRQYPHIPPEDMVIITGTCMTFDWQAAVWYSRYSGYSAGVGLEVPASGLQAGVGFCASTLRTHDVQISKGHCHNELGWENDTECKEPDGPCYVAGNGPLKNQCIFIRGIWQRAPFLRWPKILRAAAEPKDDAVPDPSSDEPAVHTSDNSDALSDSEWDVRIFSS